jgi:hypothetical protein
VTAQIPQTAVGGSLLSNGLLVAIVVLLHIQIAAYLIGSTTLAAISEAVSMVRRHGDERHDRLAHGLVQSSAYVFGFGSAVAIFFVMLALLVYWGKFFVALQQITFPTFFLEAVAFAVEIALLYTLYANWQRLARYRRARLGLLILLNLTYWWQMFFIDVVASFMLTPNGGDVDILSQFLNPTQLPLTVHRTIGNVAWAGAVIAFAGAVRYLGVTRRLERAVRGDQPAPALAPHPPMAPSRMQSERPLPAFPAAPRTVGAMAATETATEPREAYEARYWDWVAQWGAVWAIGLTIFQPWVGYSYAKEIQLHAYPAWSLMMFGDLSNVFLLQIGLLGIIFTLGSVYFWRRMKASRASNYRRQGIIAVLLVVVTVWAVQPAWFAPTYADTLAAGLAKPWWEGGLLNPFGNFIPYKVGALTAMFLLGLWSLTSYMRAVSRDQVLPARTGRRSQWLLLGLGVSVSAMMMVMGVIREHARQPYLINGELTISNQQITNNQASPKGGSIR